MYVFLIGSNLNHRVTGSIENDAATDDSKVAVLRLLNDCLLLLQLCMEFVGWANRSSTCFFL